jgi:predicted MPP superfamily phosphohydrolase
VPSLRIAHLSDIHLAGYEAGAPFDEDADLRRELEDDLQRLVKDGGPVDLLVLGGDIAGRGRTSEFEKAKHWINELCQMLGVPEERVYCVPGNHDVAQSVVDNDPVLSTLQRHLLDVPLTGVNGELEALLTNGPHRDLLLAPLESYNEFAAHYRCDMQPDEMRWADVLTVGPLTVKIVGVNSALLSGPHDAREPSKSRLLLGPQMANLGRFDDTLVILVCHHPLAWLRDRDRIQNLIERAHLQLFGHEHAADVQPLPGGGLRVHAGALHPQRSSDPWQPAYNVITLSVADTSAFPIAVEISQRCIQPNGTFGALNPASPIEPFTITGEASSSAAAGELPEAPPAPPPPPTPELDRRVARRFAALSTERRLAAGQTLGLIATEDLELDETTRARQVFHRARENDRLNELEEIIDD